MIVNDYINDSLSSCTLRFVMLCKPYYAIYIMFYYAILTLRFTIHAMQYY